MTNGYKEPRNSDEANHDNASVVSSNSASSTNTPSVWSTTSETAAEVITPAQAAALRPHLGRHGGPLNNTMEQQVAPPSQLQQQQQAELHHVCLRINWVHHSSACSIEMVRPFKQALNTAAISYIRNKFTVFDNVTDDEKAILRSSLPGLQALQITVKSVWFDGKSCDITNCPNNLFWLFACLSQKAIPVFEVEVSYMRPREVPPGD